MTASLIVDVIVILVGLVALFSGWRQGAFASILSAVGILAGIIVGLAAAPPVMGLTESLALRSLLALGVVVLLASIGNLIGATLGGSLREGMRLRAFQAVDSAVGAAFQVLVALLVCWLIAGPLATGLGKPASEGIRNSTVLQAVDRIVPDAWSQVPTRISAMLSESGLPPLVSPFAQGTSATVAAPRIEVANEELVEDLRPSVIHVMGNSEECSRRLMGSGFVTAPDYVLTNAHVVAGTESVRLDTMLGVIDSEVVFYDPEADIALLHAPGLGLAPLPWAATPADSGDEAVVMGYPESGPFEASPARISDRITIAGPDIYATGRVEREAYTVRGSIREGNSGGPLFNESGEVLGMVFGASVDNTDTGFAITAAEIQDRVGEVAAHTAPVDTRACVS
ncbi:MarP family serine protease [Corynebacterium guangdongense]|uniref:S1-C subfamily serine protease n=1 Tax=Corynebacterium guangdongense TaxID=1783348 RepID=A0ABU2A413_9CORY|nr:MarP family serine protease [Corynebacterium guangdongense]MDR7330813.1 S1-C subfamily serine protease [Corynebacterium guangdongense]WJZ16828.1 Serine protease [Corynebacterium guangdongense]